MASPGVGGSISAASDVALNNPAQDDLMLRDGGYWRNIPANNKIADIVSTDNTIQATLDSRYPRIVSYDGAGYPARPSGDGVVMFIGPTDPGNSMSTGDIWIETA